MTAAAILIVFVGWFAIGALLGGLINGLADNLPLGELQPARNRLEAVVLPRCEYCGEPRRGWRALAALQVFSGGMHCGQCTAPRKRRDLIVELLMAAALSVLWVRAPGSIAYQAGGAVVLTLFVLVTVIDFEHRLAHGLSLVGAALLLAVAPGSRHVLGAFGALVWRYFVLYGLGFVFLRLTHNDAQEAALGFGDVLLAVWVGLAVGWPAVLMSLLLAILVAGAAGLGILAWKALRRKATQGATMAYGPYLALAAASSDSADIARILLRSP
jgi:leader peptidase (prepilin peptidase)/N-methyltransferase